MRARETRLRRRIRILLDVASLLAVVTGLVICLRARSNAWFGPLLGLVIPVGRLLLSPDYRWRVEAAVFRTWEQVQQLSRGQGPIPWLAAVAFVSLPFFLLDLVHRGSLGTFDTRPVIPTAASLCERGTGTLASLTRLSPGACFAILMVSSTTVFKRSAAGSSRRFLGHGPVCPGRGSPRVPLRCRPRL